MSSSADLLHQKLHVVCSINEDAQLFGVLLWCEPITRKCVCGARAQKYARFTTLVLLAQRNIILINFIAFER